jgi:hypothetical protein
VNPPIAAGLELVVRSTELRREGDRYRDPSVALDGFVVLTWPSTSRSSAATSLGMRRLPFATVEVYKGKLTNGGNNGVAR